MSFTIARPAGAAVPNQSMQKLIWEWNGVDVSQFEATNAFASNNWDVAFSAETPTTTTRPWNKVLRMTTSCTGSKQGGVVRLLTDLDFFDTEDRSITIEYEMHDNSTSPLPNFAIGFSFLCFDTGAPHNYLFGYNSCPLGANWYFSNVEAGVANATGTPTAVGNQLAKNFTEPMTGGVLSVRADHRAGEFPRFSESSRVFFRNAYENGRRKIHAYYGGYPPTNTSWKTGDATRLGLCFQGDNVVPAGWVEFGAIRIYAGARRLVP